jgi:hypothetical protein
MTGPVVPTEIERLIADRPAYALLHPIEADVWMDRAAVTLASLAASLEQRTKALEELKSRIELAIDGTPYTLASWLDIVALSGSDR